MISTSSWLSAQTIDRFWYLTTDIGLPSMTTLAIQEDDAGYLWFAMPSGVVRWDGYSFEYVSRFRTYGNPEPTVFPLWIGRAPDRGILIGGYGGLASIDRSGKMTALLDPSDYVARNEVEGYGVTGVFVAESRPDIYWVSTAGSGLFRLDRRLDSVRVFLPDPKLPESVPSLFVTIPAEDRAGNLWIPTEAGLARLDRSDMTFHRVTDKHVVALLEDPVNPDRLWLAESDGLSRFDVSSGRREMVLRYEKTFESKPSQHHFRYEAMARSMIWDKNVSGVLWIAANTSGLYRYDTLSGKSEHYRVFYQPGFRGPTVGGPPACVYQDREGIIWIGTYGGGISYAEPYPTLSEGVNTSRLVAPQWPGQINGHVTAVMEDTRGRWWVGNRDNEGNHLLMIDRETGKERRWSGAQTGPNGAFVRFGEILAILEDRRGDIWFGELHVDRGDSSGSAPPRVVWEKGAVYRMLDDGEAFEAFVHEPDNPRSLPDGGIVSLYEDADGIIWAGTRNHGIGRIDLESRTITAVDIPDHSNSAWGFLEDQKGRVWVGTHDGICLLDRKAMACQSFDLPVHSALNTVEMAERASEPGAIWVGSWSGLYRFDTAAKTFSRPVTSGPLTTVHIVDVVADDSSALWISTDGDGVYRFDPETGSTVSLDSRRANYTLGAGMLSSSGKVVFGSSDLGLRLFDANASYGNQAAPRVTVTRVSGPVSGEIDLVGIDTSGIRLSGARESFSIEYVGLHFSDPSNNEYAYKLEGLQDDWQYVGATRRATFGRLDPGTYTFRVKAASSYGIWNEQGASLRIIVPPPWWQTGWAYALYVVLLLIMLFTGERLRHSSIVRRERHRAALRETEIRSEVAEAKAVQAAEHAHQLEKLDEAKSRFFANVSHEFRTPLTLILGAAEDIDSGRFVRPTKALRKTVQLIVESANRLDGLVRELLELARLDSGNLKLETARSDLTRLVGRVVQSQVPLAERAGIVLRYRAPEMHLLATFDARRLEMAIGNLISNAIKFTESGGEVDISLRPYEGREGDMVRIDVRDTGVGIRKDDLESVFDRFSQLDSSSTRRKEGIGIGLAITREIVEAHGGLVTVESELGVGSTFTIHLPLGEVDEIPSPEVLDADMEGPSEIGEKATVLSEDGMPEVTAQSQVPSNAPLVLIVEDNADVRAFLRDHFAAEFRVVEACDGLEGLTMARDHQPDLVISDIMMPEMDGIELCGSIKTDPDLRHTPVILVTARAGEAEALEGLDAGADEYITKPFSVAVLVQTATNMVEGRARLRADSERTLTVEPAGITIESDDEALLRRAIEVIEEHMSDSHFTIDTLADEVGFSRRQLERRIPNACGESPSELVRRLRLERARQLLEAGAGTVSEITCATGYRSSSRFASVFRRRYGLSPSEYRRSVDGG